MHPSIRILCAAMLAALVTSGCRSGISIESPLFAGAGDWPQLGGNAARSGIADGALATPLREAWRESTAGGQAGAAPLAVGGKILVTSVTGGIDIFDPANGESNGYITVRPVIAGTALVAGGTLLLPFSQSETSIAAVDLATGVVLWEKRFGQVESALLGVGDRALAATSDGRLVCFRISDSATVWSRALPEGPSAAMAGGDSLVFLPFDNGDVRAYALADGTERWRVACGASILAAPVCSGASVFAATRGGELLCLAAERGTVHWKRDLGAPVYTMPAVDGRTLLVACADGTLHCLSPATGEQRWVFRGRGPVSAPPVIAGEYAVCASTDGTVRLHALSDGKEAWSCRLDARVKTPPLVHGGMLFVCTEKKEVVAFVHGAPQ